MVDGHFKKKKKVMVGGQLDGVSLFHTLKSQSKSSSLPSD